jgi:hypothetical protein
MRKMNIHNKTGKCLNYIMRSELYKFNKNLINSEMAVSV